MNISEYTAYYEALKEFIGIIYGKMIRIDGDIYIRALLNGRIAYQEVDITGERKELYFSKLGMYSDIQKAIGAYRGIQCLYTKKVELKNYINIS